MRFGFSWKGFDSQLIESLSSLIAEKLKGREFDSFALGVSYPKMSDDDRELLKKEFQYSLVTTLKEKFSKPADFEDPDVNVLVDFNRDRVACRFKPVYVRGFYNKLVRGIPQTLHYCFKCKGRGCSNCDFTGRLSPESVQEIIASKAKPLFGAASDKFHGQGREDADVRMLGQGRGFVLELEEPRKRSIDLSVLEKEVNSGEKVKVRALEFCGKEEPARIKSLKNEKLYLAVVGCREPVSSVKVESILGKEIEVEQRTPLRVSARRADLVRKHRVTPAGFSLKGEKKFEIKLKASAGAYIKEFVSGDNGRTVPSLSSLLANTCSCVELDVLEIIPLPAQGHA